MNLIAGAPAWLVAFLALVLLAAAIEDAVRLRISNLTCAAVIVGALVAIALQGPSWSLWQNVAVFVGILAIGTPAFAAGWFGGGDIKLLAAVGLWLNLQAALGFIVAVLIAGGIVALLYILVRRIVRAYTGSKKRDGRVAYGLAIVAGAFFVFGTQLNQHRATNPFMERLAKERAAHQR